MFTIHVTCTAIVNHNKDESHECMKHSRTFCVEIAAAVLIYQLVKVQLIAVRIVQRNSGRSISRLQIDQLRIPMKYSIQRPIFRLQKLVSVIKMSSLAFEMSRNQFSFIYTLFLIHECRNGWGGRTSSMSYCVSNKASFEFQHSKKTNQSFKFTFTFYVHIGCMIRQLM